MYVSSSQIISQEDNTCLTRYDKEQYKLGSAEIMMSLEKKFRVPLMSNGGIGAGRFR